MGQEPVTPSAISRFFGALKLRDEVDVEVDLDLEPGG
jgi:hypothetical protein